jgi:hypothetical protein
VKLSLRSSTAERPVVAREIPVQLRMKGLNTMKQKTKLEIEADLILAEAGFDKSGRETSSTNYWQVAFDEQALSYEPTPEEARNGGIGVA